MIALFKKASPKWSALGLAVAVVIAGVALTNARTAANKVVPQAALSGVQSVKMVDDRVGWVLTGSAVLRTTDGGANWADVTPAAAADTASGYTARTLAAGDADAAYVTFAEQGSSSIFIFRRADAGRTWAEAEIQRDRRPAGPRLHPVRRPQDRPGLRQCEQGVGQRV